MKLDNKLPCTESCTMFWERLKEPLTRDFINPDPPAAINVRSFTGAADYLSKVSYEKRRGVRIATEKCYYVERFNWQSFIGDIVDINTSKPVRAGGPMRAAYLETVEQKGGYLSEWRGPKPIGCAKHCQVEFGIFKNAPGRKQGEVIVNKRLYGYISIIIMGDYACVSMIIGHGDYLKDQIMCLLHYEVFKWVFEQTESVIMEYGQIHSGSKGLQEWKRYTLYEPMNLIWQVNQQGS